MTPALRLIFALTLALLACAGTAVAAITEPDQDPFYAAPVSLERSSPGDILRSRPVEITWRGMPLPYRAWQILYRTSDAKNRPEATVTTVILPQAPRPPGGFPLVSYQTAEDSLGTQCAPSYTLRTGTEREIPAILQPLLRGWGVVAPDYEGPHSQYGAGRQAGHAVLDSIRAAVRFRPAGLGASTRVGMWGYSGGGLATAWATEMQSGYAPELNVVGVAAGGVPPDIEAVARAIDGGPFSGILFAAAQGIERAYPEMDVRSILNAEGKKLYEEIADKCVDEITRAGAFRRMRDMTTVPDALMLPRIQRVLAINHLGKRTPIAPAYIYHAILDQLIPIGTVDALVDEYCREGATVQYHRDPASEHVALVATGALSALSYLEDRFAGKPAPTSCPADSPAHAAPLLRIRSARRGSFLRVWLNKPARLRVGFARLARGGRSRPVATLKRRALQPGITQIRVRRRVGGVRLPSGRYRATAIATDLAGRRSRPARASLRIDPH